MQDETYTYRLIDDGREYLIYRKSTQALVAGGILKNPSAAVEEAKRHIARLQRSDRAAQQEVA